MGLHPLRFPLTHAPTLPINFCFLTEMMYDFSPLSSSFSCNSMLYSNVQSYMQGISIKKMTSPFIGEHILLQSFHNGCWRLVQTKYYYVYYRV